MTPTCAPRGAAAGDRYADMTWVAGRSGDAS